MELHNEGRYEEAIEAFQRAIAAGHREAASSYNIACGYAREGKTKEALEWLARAREAGFDVAGHIDEDDDLDHLRGIAAFDTMRGSRETKTSRRSSEAADAAREYATLAGDSNASGEELYRVAKKLYSAKSYDLAARAYHQSADAGYRIGTSRYNEACSRALAGDHAPALDLLERSVLAGFDDPSLMRKDSDLASLRSERRFGEILQLAEDLSLPGFSGGAAKLTFCPWQKRAEHYAAFAQRHPEIGRAWFNLGFAKIQTHEPKEAAAAFERALALNYRKPTAMYDLACSFALAGQRDRAFEWLFRALDEGFDGNGKLKRDSDLNSLHGDPRFREAIERAERESAPAHARKG
jgi:tetratricopeptide (TPR) repeat protein